MSAPEDTPVGGWRNPQLEHDPARAKVRPVLSAVGRRRWWFKLKGGGDRLWRRVRYPFTRRTVLRIRGEYNPKTLARERTVVDKRPIWWLIGRTG